MHPTTPRTARPRTSRPRTSRRLRATASAALAPLALFTACGTAGEQDPSPAPAAKDEAGPGTGGREVASISPRALVAHDGQVTLLDTASGQTLDSASTTGFVRLSDAGDGRHVVIADGDLFRTYDTGIRSEPHDDHAHHHTHAPGLSPVTHAATTAGHAVPHHGWTALFSDGTGEVELLRTADLVDAKAVSSTHATGAAHHGVAVRLTDGSLLHTVGTTEERSSVVVTRGSTQLARTDACPGVHGEAGAAPDADGDVVALGCTDGPVVFRGGDFHKVEVADAYARTGNLAGHPDSPVVLTDYKTDQDADLERPTRIGLLDTRDATLRTVDLGSSYWFRSLGRGPAGEALVLTYDGHLRVIDEAMGEEIARIAAIGAWREKANWQEPGPVLEVAGDFAYVSDPAARELVVVNLTEQKVTARHALPEGVTELVVTDGVAPSHAAHPEDHADHGH